MQSLPADASDRPLTQRDLDDTPDDGSRYEVIDGVLHVTPFPSFRHQQAQAQLFGALHQHVRATKCGSVFAAGLKVVLGEPTGVAPDIVFVSSARMPQMQDDGFYGAPDLVVEIISSRPALDRVLKLHKYAQAGVPHYWIVDPGARAVTAYRLEAGKYRVAAAPKADERFQPELFPGLVIDLEDLWV